MSINLVFFFKIYYANHMLLSVKNDFEKKNRRLFDAIVARVKLSEVIFANPVVTYFEPEVTFL